MEKQYYILNELIKSYHIFARIDQVKAAVILKRINEYRLQIVTLAAQRQIFIEQLEVVANASGYKNDIFFTHDDIASLVIRFITNLDNGVLVSLVQEGTRENIFTRQAIAWQQLMSNVQGGIDGQQIPFDLPQEIFLDKSQTLDIGIIGETNPKEVYVHGCNLVDMKENIDELVAEINLVEFDGTPNIPKPQLVPIQFVFPSAVVNTEAVAVDGGKDIYSIKSERSCILTHVSITNLDMRLDLIDKGRDMEICNKVDAQGIAGIFNDQYTVYYPLPYPHLLRMKDRIQLRALNGATNSNVTVDADAQQAMCFKGFTI